MRQSGRALRKLIRSAAAAGFWSGAAKDEKHDLTSKPLLQAARQGYRDRLLRVCGKTVRNAAFLPLAI
jgi:hypothetical protein